MTKIPKRMNYNNYDREAYEDDSVELNQMVGYDYAVKEANEFRDAVVERIINIVGEACPQCDNSGVYGEADEDGDPYPVQCQW